ncbi:hypothetical protein [Lutimaribacter pacificus]|uniref:hypothetical protein n=1 Tax=Lutimaribacter pacificus TaxID=391948 RepID=UPI00165FE120|nr:hypothetical protein [Lutimaribacter pacificus]
MFELARCLLNAGAALMNDLVPLLWRIPPPKLVLSDPCQQQRLIASNDRNDADFCCCPPGRAVAIAQGKVIYRNHLAELIHYVPGWPVNTARAVSLSIHERTS